MRNNLTKIFAVMAMSVMTVAAMATDIPLSIGTYLTTSDAATTGTINNNDGGNLGSIQKTATATFTLTNASAQEMVLCFLTGNNNSSNPTVTVTLNDGSGDFYTTGAVSVPNIGGWTPATKHVFDLGTVPAGTISLKFYFDNESSYVCNLGSIGVYSKSAYLATLDEMPGDITLNKGTYQTARIEGGGNVGYMSNGASAYYPSLYASYEGTATLNIGMVHYGDGTLNVQITDLSTGTVEVNENLDITSAVCSGLENPTAFELGDITAGFKSLKLTVSTAASYLCNYKALSLAIDGTRASITDATIDGQTTTTGSTTDWICYLPYVYSPANTTIAVTPENGTVAAAAVDDESEAVTVTADGNNFTIPTPANGKYTDVTFTLTPDDGYTAPKSTYTYRVYRIGEISLTSVTVDGVAVDVLTDINNSETSYTATVTSCYTTAPTVAAVQVDEANATVGDPSIDGSTYTYTIHGSMAGGTITRDYTLVLNNVHVYAATGDEESVNIKNNEGTRESNTWSNGVYSLATTSLDGYNQYFKMNGDDYTISLPADVVVKQLILKECSNNYSGNDARLLSVTLTGATAYIPVENKLYHDSEGAKHDIIVNLSGHTPGTDISFNMPKRGQPMCWIQLTVVYQDPETAPVKTADNVAYNDNDAVVAVSFDRVIAKDVTATIGGNSVKAKGGASTLYFPVWDLAYSSSNTLTIAANAVEDNYGYKNASAIEIAVNIPAKTAVTLAVYDYVVSNASELDAAIAAVKSSNTSASAARKTIFLKNGNYTYGTLEGSYQYNVSLKIDNWNNVYNVSLIGESKEGVVIEGTTTGITSSTLNLGNGTGIYLQDLTVRNNYDFHAAEFKGVSVAVTGGKKAILKNVAMQANQDTYVTGDRTYLENCDIYGTVDFICGGGDIFFDHCNLILCNRAGNYVTAPNTTSDITWGYVFDHCTIKADEGATAVVNGSYTLGRPWQNEPRANFLYTTMNVLCGDAGWSAWGNMPTHFYEYKSYNSAGIEIDLSSRAKPSSSTNDYTPVLTDEQAAEFTVHNVLGGTDAWDAAALAAQVSAPTNAAAEGYTIMWTAVEDALLYAIFKDGAYLANVTTNSYTADALGIYTIKASNRFGGLSEASIPVEVTVNSANTFERAHAHMNLNTLCFPYQIDNYTGATFYTLTYKVMDGEEVQEVILDEHEGALAAGHPYFYIPEAGYDKLVCNYSGSNVEAQTIDGVVGSYDDNSSVPADSYVTYNGQIRKAGTGVTLGEYRAYIDMSLVSATPTPAMAGRRRLSIHNADAPAGTTDIENVSATFGGSQKILRNGQLFIIRDGKTYNAQGQLLNR